MENKNEMLENTSTPETEEAVPQEPAAEETSVQGPVAEEAPVQTPLAPMSATARFRSLPAKPLCRENPCRLRRILLRILR